MFLQHVTAGAKGCDQTRLIAILGLFQTVLSTKYDLWNRIFENKAKGTRIKGKIQCIYKGHLQGSSVCMVLGMAVMIFTAF